MNEHASHPGRSVDFLSRLHDGELTAAERAHFESHRAHCAECRHAAAEFEAALSLYRTSRSTPAAPDLAARILHTLQSSTPRRRPFGVFFGIDLKWAAAFAAALLAVVIGSSIVFRREVPLRRDARDEPISVLLEGKEASHQKPVPRRARSAATVDSLGAPARSVKKGSPVGAPPAAPNAAIDLDVSALPPNAQKAKAEQPSSAGAGLGQSAAATRALVAPAPPPPGERPGGEGAIAGSTVSGEAQLPRLVILPADGESTVPALLPGASLQPLAGERGREFLLIVEAQGRVAEARPAGSSKRSVARVEAKEIKPPSPATKALLDLRFQPGDRPRRLLVRVE